MKKNIKIFKENFWETLKFIILAIIIVVPVRIFIAQPFVVSGSSMYPTFHNGEYLIVDELSYRLNKPKRNDVIIFKYPQDPSKFFIKRIIGLPNETIDIIGESITITNNTNKQGFTLDQSYVLNKMENPKMHFELKQDEYFVMGDNRAASSDSRYWGPVNQKLLIGKPFLRLFPINNIDYKPGELK